MELKWDGWSIDMVIIGKISRNIALIKHKDVRLVKGTGQFQ